MAEDTFEKFRSLGMEKHAGRLARICSDATQIIVGDGLLRTDVSRDDAGRAVITDLDNAAERVTDDGAFVLDRVREIGEAGLQAALERAYVPDPAALESFRASARRYGGILRMLEMQLGGAGDKLNVARSKMKSDFDNLPTGPMTIMSADYG